MEKETFQIKESFATSVIQSEIRRQGVCQSSVEKELITREVFRPARPPKPDSPAIREEAAMRLKRVLGFMERSMNSYFREATTFLRPLVRTGELELCVRPDQPGRNGDVSVMTTFPQVQGHCLFFTIEASAGEIVNVYDSVQIALQMVHEAEHVRSLRTFDLDMRRRGFLAAKRYVELQKRPLDISAYILEEGRAYAKQAQAYIYEAGLLGGCDEGSSDERRAIAFIRSGSKPDSAEWLRYLMENQLTAGIKTREIQRL